MIHRLSGDASQAQKLGPYSIEALLSEQEECAGTVYRVRIEPHHRTSISYLRIAEEFKPQGKEIQFMAPTVCMCSTMARIDPQHLCWTLENLAAGKVVNRITVPEPDATHARIALDRMLAVS